MLSRLVITFLPSVAVTVSDPSMAFAYSFGQSFVHSFIHSADTQCTNTYEAQVPSEPAGLAVTKRSFWPFSPFGLQSIYCVLNLHGLGRGRGAFPLLGQLLLAVAGGCLSFKDHLPLGGPSQALGTQTRHPCPRGPRLVWRQKHRWMLACG